MSTLVYVAIRGAVTEEDDRLDTYCANSLVTKVLLWQDRGGAYRLSGGTEHPLEDMVEHLLDFVRRCDNADTLTQHRCVTRVIEQFD